MITRITATFLFFCCLSANAQVFEDSYFRQEAEKSLNLIYNFKFTQAEKSLLALQQKYKDHPAPHFLLAINRWWQTYISETSPTYYEYIERELNTALELNEAFEDKPAFLLEYTFFQYMGHAFKARFHILQKDYFKGANAGRKALPYLKNGFDFKDKAPEFYFSSGIYHYYAEAFPRAHPVVKPFSIFFPDGSILEGLKEMEQSAVSFNFTQVEAMFYLGDIYLNEVNRLTDGLGVTQKLHERYPDNTWFEADYARALIMNTQLTEAEKHLDKLIEKFETQSSYLKKVWTSSQTTYTSQLMINVYQAKGLVLYQRDKAFREALALFSKSDQMATLSGIEAGVFLPANAYYRGLCFDHLGQRDAAVKAYRAALNLDDNGHVKEKARNCLQAPCLD